MNADFESRKSELERDGPRAYEADAAVLETARAVGDALRSLNVEVEELRVTSSLRGIVAELARRDVHTVFNLVESIDNDYGREWQVPALLARHGIRYTGNGAEALRLCRMKDRVRRVLARAGVRVAQGACVQDETECSAAALQKLVYPLFVKPARVDGSIGIDRASICRDEQELRARVSTLAATLPGPYLIEEYLPGKELNVALFPEPRAGLVVATEIDFSPVPGDLPPIVTYDAKWNPESPEYLSRSVPAQLPDELRAEVERTARAAFRALSGTGYGRVDMRLDALGAPCVIDVNPNNDIHPDAGLALAAKSVGWDYAQLIGSVLSTAAART